MKKTIEITGSPKDIGCELFVQLCMPAVREAARKMDPSELAEVYAGLIGATYGAMAADFGKDRAIGIVRHIADQLEAISLPGGMTQ